MQQDIDKPALVDFFVTRRTPPWRPMASREMASILGVSLQSLANWRVRGTGPEAEPPKKGKGNRTFYRPDKVLSWLDGAGKEPWEYSRQWFLNRDIDVVGGLDKESTAWMIEGMDELL